MLKIVAPSDFNFDQPIMSIVDMHSRGVDKGWLRKSAAVLTKEMRELRPQKGTTYVHLIALGDAETTGGNRNNDVFPKSANVKYHHTFVKHANWYHDHKNRPERGDKVYGKVAHSAYNDDMGRVELIVGISEKDDPDSIEKLARGEDLPVSMACSIPYDICSICGNKAYKKADYCDCITEHLGQLTKEGKQVAMINTKPTFFDISRVDRNADRIAFTLRKVASDNTAPTFSVDLAAAYGIVEPEHLIKDSKYHRRTQLLRKLAEMEKRIEGEILADPHQADIANALQEGCDELPDVPGDKLNGVLGALADARISLPVSTFLRLVMGSRFDEISDMIPEVEAACPSVFREAVQDPQDFLSGVENYEPLDLPLPKSIKESIQTLSRVGSLNEEPVKRRVTVIKLRKAGSKFVAYEKSPSKAAKVLAREYARYKLAFLDKCGQDPFVTKLSLLQDFVW